MIQYKYHRAVSLDDVVNVLKEYGGKARIVAGGNGHHGPDSRKG